MRGFLFLVAAAAFLFTPAKAEGIVKGVRAGVLAQSCCGWAVDKEQGVAINGEVVFKSPRVLDVLFSPRPVVGFAVATDSDATSQLYTGLDWQFDLTSKIYLGFGAGAVLHNGETDAFDPARDRNRVTNTHFYGCRVLFHGTADIGVHLTEHLDLEVHWSHMSHAGVCGDNEALDHLGLRFGWNF